MKKFKSIFTQIVAFAAAISITAVVPQDLLDIRWAVSVDAEETGADENLISGTTGNCTWTYDSTSKTLTISPVEGTDGATGTYEEDIGVQAPWNTMDTIGSSNIDYVNLKDGITSLGQGLFKLSQIKSIVIPGSVKTIGRAVFYQCYYLENVTLSSGLTEIQTCAFEHCNSLTEITIPDTVTYLADYSLGNCESLKKVNIKSLNINLNSTAFIGSNNIKEFVVPCTSEYTIYNFLNASAPPTATVTKAHNFVDNKCSYCELIGGTTGDCSWKYDEETKTITISGDGSMADYDMYNTAPWVNNEDYPIINVVIGDGVTNIGKYAFYGCTDLTNVTIESASVKLGENVFSMCENLKKITVPCNSTTVFDDSVSDKVVKPHSIEDNKCTVCGQYGITGKCIWTLSSSNDDGQIDTLVISGNGAMADYNDIDSVPWNVYRNQLTTVIIEDGVTNIGAWALAGCENLKDITIPKSVISIGDGAIGACVSLTSIDIPESVESIGENAFVGCSGLTSITIPNSVTSMGKCVFASCSSLESIIIPEGVTSIENMAFYYCQKLNSVTIPKSVTRIGEQVLAGCESLETINVPCNSETSKDDFKDSNLDDKVSVVKQHNWSLKWENDEEYHWHKCLNDGCTEITDKEKHKSGGSATEESPEICTVCEYEMNSATGHIHTNHLKYIDKVEPTGCTTDGTKAHYKCSCGKLFEDNQATNEVTADELKITAAHSYSDTLTSDADYHYYVCSKCSDKKDKAAHSFDDGVTVTDSVKGKVVTTYTCKTCGYTKKTEKDLDKSNQDNQTGSSNQTGDNSSNTAEDSTIKYNVDITDAKTAVTVDDDSLKAAVGIEKEENTGKTITVNLRISDKTDDKPDEAKVQTVLSSINATTLGAFFDIAIEKRVTDETGSVTKTTVTETNSEIAITITIPADMQYGSEYKVIRVHSTASGDEITVLDTAYDENEQTLTFKTDRFSTYAIAYIPKNAADTTDTSATTGNTDNTSNTSATTGNADNSTDDDETSDEDSTASDTSAVSVPDTGDHAPIRLILTLMLMSLTVMISLGKKIRLSA